MIYLASPYSHPDPLIRKTRFLLAQERCAELLKLNVWVYSPIVHCHEMAEVFDLPTDFEYWRAYNFDMLRRADGMEVMQIDGWKESAGVKAEFQFARTAGIAIAMYEPPSNREAL